MIVSFFYPEGWVDASVDSSRGGIGSGEFAMAFFRP